MEINSKYKIGAMLDSGSTSSSASPIANFIDEEVAHNLKLIQTCKCNCKPSLTCTPMGCFQNNGCIELQCRLYRPNNNNEINTKLKFRVVKGLTKYGSLPIILSLIHI